VTATIQKKPREVIRAAFKKVLVSGTNLMPAIGTEGVPSISMLTLSAVRAVERERVWGSRIGCSLSRQLNLFLNRLLLLLDRSAFLHRNLLSQIL